MIEEVKLIGWVSRIDGTDDPAGRLPTYFWSDDEF